MIKFPQYTMNTRILLTSLFLWIMSISPLSSWAAGSCQITSGPIPQLAQYQRDTEATIARLVTASQANCGTTPLTRSAMRTVEVADRALFQIPQFPNVSLDFLYNIRTTISGDARGPVMRDGKIFLQIDARINKAIDSVTSKCTLDAVTENAFV